MCFLQLFFQKIELSDVERQERYFLPLFDYFCPKYRIVIFIQFALIFSASFLRLKRILPKKSLELRKRKC